LFGFIINPLSGNGKGASVWAGVQVDLERKNISYKYAATTRRGEASELVRNMMVQHTITTLIIVGGDGTVHEAIAGLWLTGELGRACRIGVIPAGTGNDFVRAHGIPHDPYKALSNVLLPDAPVRRIDVIVSNQDFIAVNSIGAGFDGMVAKLTNEAGYKKLFNRLGLGQLSYFITMLRVFLMYKPTAMQLVLDGSNYKLPNTWLTAVTNIPYYGGSMQICPQAVPDDGFMDIMVIQSPGRLRLFPIMLSVYAGKHTRHPAVSFYRAQSVTVRSESPLLAQTDGEQADTTPFSIQVAPSALAIITSYHH
jgi:diacylglycerol kinase (ATP)